MLNTEILSGKYYRKDEFTRALNIEQPDPFWVKYWTEKYAEY